MSMGKDVEATWRVGAPWIQRSSLKLKEERYKYSGCAGKTAWKTDLREVERLAGTGIYDLNEPDGKELEVDTH